MIVKIIKTDKFCTFWWLINLYYYYKEMAFMPGGRCLRDHSIKMGQQISLMSANVIINAELCNCLC